MAPLSVLLAAIALAPGVHSGSPVWESSVKLQAPHPVEHLAVDAAGYAVRDNETHEAIFRRWVAINPQEGPGKSKLWPQKTISYCYETQEAEDMLGDYILAAARKWQDAGLSRDVYKYVKTVPSGTACSNGPGRASTLMISFNTDGKLETTLGYRSLDSSDPSYKGPTMQLSVRTDIGMLDATSNIAHEMGHAWGLTHEHQNPYFWGGTTGMRTKMDGAPFGGHFNCQALKDFLTIQAKLAAEPALSYDLALICENRNVAQKHGFSAAEWLPYIGLPLRFEVTKTDAGYVDVDWRSIMLYPSGAGGIGNAAPPAAGQALGANDHRQDVLLRNDGVRIGYNFDPSDRDVQGIRALYEAPAGFPEGSLPVLPSDKKSKWYDKFKPTSKKGKCL